jgi:hypothetical protein
MRTVRYRIERRHFRDQQTGEEGWSDQSITGAKTLKQARNCLKTEMHDSPSYFKRADFRIVRVTIAREVVK